MPEDRWIRVSEAEKMFDAVAEELGKELAKRMQEDFMYWREGIPSVRLSDLECVDSILVRLDGKTRSLRSVRREDVERVTHYILLKEPV